MRVRYLAPILLSTWTLPIAPLPGTERVTQTGYSGTWRGRLLSSNRDSVMTPWTWVNGPDGTGSMTFADEMAAVPTRVVSATTASVVFELLRPLTGSDSMWLTFVGNPSGDSLTGDARVRVRDGRTSRRPFGAVRVGPLPAIEPADCPFTPPVSHIECGWLVVPESRSRPDGRTVRLNVVVVRAVTPTTAPPTVFISGGPGQAGAPIRYNPSLIARARDVIYYDQRATGRSQPDLCPQFDVDYADNRNRNTDQARIEREKQLIQRCVELLRTQGIDAESYNTSTSAHDLADLRRALGYQRWILRGGSYGTRLAQETMRADPLGVHATILIAPVPPGEQGEALEWRLSIQRGFEKVFAACGADAACHAAFPDPRGDFFAVWEELQRTPMLLPNAQDTVILHGDRLVQSLVRLFDGNTGVARIPFLLNELRRGDRLRAARELAPSVDARPGANAVAVALNRLVNCYESGGIRPGVVDSANTVPLPPFRQKLDPDACRTWRTRFATESERAPLHSDIPTLIISGEYDIRTPTENGRHIARTLERAYVYELPAVGHSGSTVCGVSILQQFTEDPSREPDASCLTRSPKLTFATKW